jgi:hypothetical protein
MSLREREREGEGERKRERKSETLRSVAVLTRAAKSQQEIKTIRTTYSLFSKSMHYNTTDPVLRVEGLPGSILLQFLSIYKTKIIYVAFLFVRNVYYFTLLRLIEKTPFVFKKA